MSETSWSSPWPRWVSLGLSVVAAVLVLVNIVLAVKTASVQEAVRRRQNFIVETGEVSRVDNTLIRALAMRAAAKHDGAIAALLKRAGITYHLNAPPSAPAPGKP